MGEKILTISVAAHNVEKTLRETLNSLVVPEILDKLEVFVVDDGGTDGSLDIAKEFEERYPETFHAVHKENGGYGSTVNWSLAHATGKYFKPLDGDDWFSCKNLPDYVKLLSEVKTDGVISTYIMRRMRSGSSVEYVLCSDEVGIHDISELHAETLFDMFFLAWKTELLKSIDLKLQEHCMYTDTQYAYYPISVANDVYCWDRPVYIYRTEADGQTMSLSGKIKYYKDHASVIWGLMDRYHSIYQQNQAVSDIYRCKLASMSGGHIRLWCWMEPSDENKKSLKAFVDRLKKEAPEVLDAAKRQSKLVFALVKTNFAIFPFVHCYCVWKMRRSRGGGD